MRTARENLNREVKFKDLEPDDKKDLNMTIAPYADPSFDTKLAEIDLGIQVAPSHVDSSAQTIWRYPRNAVTQYEPRSMDETECEKILNSDSLSTFLKETLPQ